MNTEQQDKSKNSKNASTIQINTKLQTNLKENNIIRLKNEILRSTTLSSEAKMVYISLRYLMNYHLLNKPLICSSDTLAELFLISNKSNIIQEDKKLHKIINKGLIDLEEEQLIKIFRSSTTIYVLDISPLQFEYSTGGYTKVTERVIKDILMLSEPEDTRKGFIYKIVLYYIILSNTINNKTKVGFTPINTLREYTGFGQITIEKINNILEDAQMIKIYRQWETYIRNSGKIHIEGNKYYLPEDEQIALHYIDKRETILSEEEQLCPINREVQKGQRIEKRKDKKTKIKNTDKIKKDITKETDNNFTNNFLEIDDEGNFIF